MAASVEYQQRELTELRRWAHQFAPFPGEFDATYEALWVLIEELQKALTKLAKAEEDLAIARTNRSRAEDWFDKLRRTISHTITLAEQAKTKEAAPGP